jgi:hypothetical protein
LPVQPLGVTEDELESEELEIDEVEDVEEELDDGHEMSVVAVLVSVLVEGLAF